MLSTVEELILGMFGNLFCMQKKKSNFGESAILIPLFDLDCFKSDFVEKATSCPQMKMLHLEAIHTFGAVISAHQVCVSLCSSIFLYSHTP